MSACVAELPRCGQRSRSTPGEGEAPRSTQLGPPFSSSGYKLPQKVTRGGEKPSGKEEFPVPEGRGFDSGRGRKSSGLRDFSHGGYPGIPVGLPTGGDTSIHPSPHGADTCHV